MTRTLIITLVALVGCLPSPADLFSGNNDEMYLDSNARGSMKGELPVVGEFATDEASYAYIEDAEEYGYLELHTLNDDGWAMIGMDYNLRNIDDGETVDVDPDASVGCSGPDTYDAEFDEAPDEATITREDVEINGIVETTYKVHAVFANGNVVDGTIQPTPNDG